MARTGFIARERTAARPFVPDAIQQQILALDPRFSAAVLGAPGTGKSTVLIELVAARVKAGTLPDNIAVLSPNRVSAGHLRNALGLRLGVATNGALARTPGSLAFAIAQEHALATGQLPPRMLTGSEQDSIITERMKAAGCIVIGARAGVDGPWRIETVTHSYSRSGGFVTSLDLKAPGSTGGSQQGGTQ